MFKNYFLWLFKFITVLIVIIFLVPMLIAGIGMVVAGEDQITGGKVAVVELLGPIYDSKDVLDELYRQVANEHVDGIVLRVDSPGGAVGPSQEIYSAVAKLKLRKPIVASMGSVAASGGLYASLAASKIYAQPGTLTGSIGVILELPNVKGIAEKVGFNMTTIKSGELKDVGNMFRDMQESEKQYLGDVAASSHADFIKAVVEGRGIPFEKVKSFADGRVLLGNQAMALGLVDKMGDVYDAAREVYVILGKPLADDKDAKLYYPQDKFRDFEAIIKGAKALANGVSFGTRLKYEMQ
jgi:protease-4